MNKKEQKLFNTWFEGLKNVKITRKTGSNRDEAFYRGYKNMRLSNNRKPYHKDSTARIIYNAGQAVRKYQRKT